MVNLLKSEFIGKNIEVISSKNNVENAFKGIIMDETLSSFKILHNEKIKTLLKKNITFKIDNSDMIKGSDVAFRPEDRIKKVKPNG